jgi:hypothetical protein
MVVAGTKVATGIRARILCLRVYDDLARGAKIKDE